MKEIILSYEKSSEINPLINKLKHADFLLVRQSNKTQQLFFKKIKKLPTTHISSDE